MIPAPDLLELAACTTLCAAVPLAVIPFARDVCRAFAALSADPDKLERSRDYAEPHFLDRDLNL